MSPQRQMKSFRILGPLRITLLFLLSVVLTPNAAVANSSAYNGVGGNLLPIPERRVAMISEHISFYQGKKLRWRVEARYRFANRTKKTVKINLGFPLIARIKHGRRRRKINPFRHSFRVHVNGKPVPFTARPHGCNPKKARFCYDFVHLVPVSFEPRKIVEVTYSYHQMPSGDNSEFSWFLDYILETGALWAEPIGSATFSFRFAQPTSELRVHDKLFHRGLLTRLISCRLANNPPPKCNHGFLRLGEGTVRLWSNQTKFSYRTTCDKRGNLYLRLHARQLTPTGNISVAYVPADGHRADPWCPTK